MDILEIRAFAKLLGGLRCLDVGINLEQLRILWAIIHVVMLLEFAGVSFPSEISRVDGFNHEIHVVRWHVIKM